jgi:hypothetical protein
MDKKSIQLGSGRSEQSMKGKLLNVCVVVYLLLLIFALGTLSVPPRDLPIYGGMLITSIVAFVLAKEKTRRWRIVTALGVGLAVIGSLLQVVAWVVR